MVGIGAIVGYWIGCMSLMVISWTIIGNQFPTKYGVYVGGTLGCSSTRYTFPST